MLQLELGMFPLKKEISEGMNVVFFVTKPGKKGGRTKKTVSHIGRIVSIESGNMILEDIVFPGSRFNRPIEKIFEIHKDTSLDIWSHEGML